MRYFIYTMGCQMNYSDTERLEAVLANLGYQKTDRKYAASLIFYNTCSVRQKAEDKVFGQIENIEKLKKQNPKLIFGLTGCMVKKTSTKNSADKDPLLKRLEALDLVLKITDLAKLPELLKEFSSLNIKEEISLPTGSLANYFQIQPKHSSGFQAFIPIMTGCDNYCAYCVVPGARGREKSRLIPEIMAEAKKLVENGCLEITLLGQNVNSYGLSLEDQKAGHFKNFEKKPFIFLLEELHKLPELKRLRFTSSHPKDMTADLIEAITTLPKMCPYVHLPVQSGDNEVLKKMNRNYTHEKYRKIIQKIRAKRPDCAISTDIIVGFPGETEEQFMNTYKLYDDLRFDMCYLAAYSPRKGTPAYKLTDDISNQEKTRRWHFLNKLLLQSAWEKNAEYLGKTVEVLVEQWRAENCLGRSASFKTVQFPGEKDLIGQLIKVKINEVDKWVLKGERI